MGSLLSRRGKRIAGADHNAHTRRTSLWHLFSWTLTGNVLYAACQWALLIILAQRGSVEDVGVFSLALAISAPIFLFTNMQLRGILATDTEQLYASGVYVQLRVISSCLALIATLGCAAMYMSSWETCIAIVLIGISKWFESISELLYGWWQQHHRMDWSAQSLILRGLLSLSLFGGAYLYTQSLLAALTVYALTWGGILIAFDIPRARRLEGFTWSGSRRAGLQLLQQCWPMGIVMMLVSLQANVPRYFISDAYGEAALGYFSALMYVMVAATTVVSALGQSISPHLARAWSAVDRHALRAVLRKATYIIVAIGVGMTLGSWLLGSWLLTMLYGANYAQYSDLFLILTISTAFSCLGSLLGFALTAARVFRAQLVIHLCTVLITVVLQYTVTALNMPMQSTGYTLLASNLLSLVLAGIAWRNCMKALMRQKLKTNVLLSEKTGG
ncbi:lipopolysaccharide biosynthesis protein [Paenibacillus arenosi]|uniref:Lipopolysaccharide biosynthesis protein n=1 Tax=Paenibacillus arenosi TaxID=2774142 RepID=A0ABR9AYR0_9BACL|nr:lipopolysaccharide biosynthesis protein [Paenibacillus arenosi]MBD8498335.1 lipopolysaccharide biosynthesis protein [Paenibacillus arenosi]